MRTLRIILLAGAVTAISAAGAIAAGGGGGGGGGGAEMPSASAPQYNAAEEYAKAIRSLEAKDYKAAARAAEHVTQVAPKDVSGWKVLGVANSGAANWKGAKRAWERAVKIDGEDLDSRAGLAMALANLKDAKAQEQLAWLKAKAANCTINCNAAKLQAVTAEVEKAIGGDTAAAPAAGPAASLETGALIFAQAGDQAYVQAVSLINEKRYDEALASLDAARAAFGPHPDVLTYQGYTWRKKGQYDRAEDYYKQALALAPNHRGATEYYGELKVERGDVAGAKVMLAKLDRLCTYGCAEAEELRRWIDAGGDPAQ